MYQASASFITAIKSNTRKITWGGTITETDGTVLSFAQNNIINGGSITRSISSQSLSVGTAYASTLSLELILSGVSRYELYGATLEIHCSVEGASDEIPMGVYTISEAVQSLDHISVKGYDNMVKLDNVAFSPSQNNNIQAPRQWLLDMCGACGIVLGSSSADIEALPNGSRKTGFADVVTDAKTWRDVLGYLTAYLGGFAYIGRDGKLYIGSYGSNSADTVPSTFRYSSGLSDFRTCYDGIYATYKEEGLQEYVPNTNSGGIILNLGVNPFLQFSNSGNRQDALQEIIDSFNGVYYVPYSAEMPLVPTYDPGDVLTFTDNQAGAYDYGAITEITYNIAGTMSVKCSGDNPRLADAEDRFTKSVAGLSSDYNNGQETGAKNFWLLHTENDAALTVGSTKTLVAKIDWDQKVDVQRMGFMFTCEADLSATATVEILITVDDESYYEFDVTEEKAMKGKRIFTSDCGFRVTDKGSHSAKVYMTVTDNPTIWSDLV